MFQTITGQDDAVVQLARALERPVNTYVFFGSRGTYVEEAARIFASRLVDPTGFIDDRVSKSHYADVIEFEPMGVSFRVKEDVRESMLGEFRKSPIEGSKKVLIVHDAHLLREDSANTLLKSLEEPPDNFFWILIAPSQDSLLATIRSRCYSIQFSRLTPQVIEQKLVEEGIEAARAHDVSLSCSGRLDRARNLSSSFAPLRTCAKDVVESMSKPASFAAVSARKIVETFDEISSDVIAKNKLEMESIKNEMKDSGYSDKIAQSIVASAKVRIEAREKRLRHELLYEFLDALHVSFASRALSLSSGAGGKDTAQAVVAGDVINEYRKRLLFNPSELLFLESMLASISLREIHVNS